MANLALFLISASAVLSPLGVGGSSELSELATYCTQVLEEGQSLSRQQGSAGTEEQQFVLEVGRAVGSCDDPRLDARTRAGLLLLASQWGPGSEPVAARGLLHNAQEILDAEAPRSREYVRVLERLSSVEFTLGNVEESSHLLKEALDLRRDAWGADSPEAVDGEIALVYHDLALAEASGDMTFRQDALEAATRVLAKAVKGFGPDAPIATRAWAALSAVRRELGDRAEAQALFEAHVSPRLDDLDQPLEEPRPPQPR